ncbi:endoplasmin homolog [Condylostylus longicornis]|uniref:endoplasmin homolog n=1 Tax=Condylostylus longicornis TaxID=2530218 RepID=UPI00244DF3ED|nr:endoplasmin homolog [Condylostylus longicornis]
MKKHKVFIVLSLLLILGYECKADEIDLEDVGTADPDITVSKKGSMTDPETVAREADTINIDGLSIQEIKNLREQSEKFTFQTEVNRMMKLIINSLYRNKEIFLRELISNASDALDKIRLLSLTDRDQLSTNPELEIKVKADKENKILHIIDSGIGMTKTDLINNLGTIAKSGTADFLSKMQNSQDAQDLNDMIGQFGVGFYSAFLVAERVVVTSKHNDDKQYIWESDSGSYSIVEDPRGDSLKRGTVISLYLKDEARDFLEEDTVKKLIQKYSQFINFPIYMWGSKEVEEEIDAEEAGAPEENKSEEDVDDDAKVEDDAEEKPKTKKITKTVWDWQILNENKPLWTKKPADVSQEEYMEFYKSITKDKTEPLAYTHFVAEGEVTFKSLLFVPKVQPSESFNRYGTKSDNIKLFVRRVFITDEFNDMMPNYLNFVRGVVDSDDLPLNVSRETLQQHKLIKVIKKKLVRKVLDMLKKLDKEQYQKFWQEYSTNIKLGIMEDPSNRSRLAKLLRFQSSKDPKQLTSLEEYTARMKKKQERIYYIAGASRTEVETSPFVERLLAKGYEIIYLVEAVDEYCLSALPEFDGKKFQNIAKEGFSLNEPSKNVQQLSKEYAPLTKWFDNNLKDYIAKAEISERLSKSPCALVAGMFGWTGNMERLAMSNAHQKSDDPQRSYYLNQKKTLEINPRHPLIKELLRRVEADENDSTALEIAKTLVKTATLRSGYMLKETAEYADTIDKMLMKSLDISADDNYDFEEPDEEESNEADNDTENKSGQDETEDDTNDNSEHDEL